jgi:hypothetical protein
MADPTNPEAPVTPTPSDPASPANEKLLEALNGVVDRISRLEQGGVSHEEATRATASNIGVQPEILAKMINDASAAGNPGEGVVRATGMLLATVAARNDEREGKREVENLATNKKYTEAFETYGTDFKKFLAREGVSYVQLAEPGAASKVFDYFLAGNTDWSKKQRDKEVEAVRTETRRQVEEELRVRRPTSGGTPSMTPGARPEGGALRSLVMTQSGDETPTERQSEIMSNLGLDEAAQKRAMKVQATKSAMGVSLDFVVTRNEGAV